MPCALLLYKRGVNSAEMSAGPVANPTCDFAARVSGGAFPLTATLACSRNWIRWRRFSVWSFCVSRAIFIAGSPFMAPLALADGPTSGSVRAAWRNPSR